MSSASGVAAFDYSLSLCRDGVAVFQATLSVSIFIFSSLSRKYSFPLVNHLGPMKRILNVVSLCCMLSYPDHSASSFVNYVTELHI